MLVPQRRFPPFPTPLKKMLLASCHGLSGSFSVFLLGESPPYSSRNGENSLSLSSFLQAPVRISVPFTRREACGLQRLIASLPLHPQVLTPQSHAKYGIHSA